MKRFEYKVENIQIQSKNGSDFNTKINERLNSLGEEGWELSGVNGTVFYFKREITYTTT
nr:DUF4177 domain-containing protein [Fredinandcohnia onubensis]